MPGLLWLYIHIIFKYIYIYIYIILSRFILISIYQHITSKIKSFFYLFSINQYYEKYNSN